MLDSALLEAGWIPVPLFSIETVPTSTGTTRRWLSLIFLVGTVLGFWNLAAGS